MSVTVPTSAREVLEREHERATFDADTLAKLALRATCDGGTDPFAWSRGYAHGREDAYTWAAKRAIARKIEIAAELAVLP